MRSFVGISRYVQRFWVTPLDMSESKKSRNYSGEPWWNLALIYRLQTQNGGCRAARPRLLLRCGAAPSVSRKLVGAIASRRKNSAPGNATSRSMEWPVYGAPDCKFTARLPRLTQTNHANDRSAPDKPGESKWHCRHLPKIRRMLWACFLLGRMERLQPASRRC